MSLCIDCKRDVFLSDEDCEAFMRDCKDRWNLSCMMRSCSKRRKRYMSKLAFKKWKDKNFAEIDDDKPLKDIL